MISGIAQVLTDLHQLTGSSNSRSKDRTFASARISCDIVVEALMRGAKMDSLVADLATSCFVNLFWTICAIMLCVAQSSEGCIAWCILVVIP